MKLKINIEFKDKYNGKKYAEGEVVDFEDERAKELLADKRNLVSKVKEEAPKSEDETKTEAKPKKSKKK